MIEIGLFIAVGGEIGVVVTLLLIVLTAVIGSFLVRQQGFGVLRKLQQNSPGSGDMSSALFDGLCIGVAGMMLITPGFFTDSVGFLLLVPPVRRFLYGHMAKHIQAGMHRHMHTQGPAPNGRTRKSDPVIINGEFEDITEDRPMPPPRGKWD